MLIEVILILELDLGGQSEVLLPSKWYVPSSNKHLVMHTDWCSEPIYFKTRTAPTSCEMAADFTDTV